MTKKIRVGVIGVGHLGRYHALKYAALEDVDLVSVADLNLQQAQLVATETGAVPCTDYRELAGKVDAVSIAANTTSHFEVGRFCLENGMDVMMEKPITLTLQEADALLKIAAEGGRILQVGLIERFNPAMQAARPHLNLPLFIESKRVGVFTPRSADVDVIIDLMIHDLDIILALVRAPIESISAVGAPVITPHTDIVNAHIIFANGCTANLTTSRVAPVAERRMRIFQPGECLDVDFQNKECVLSRLAACTPEATQHPVQESLTVSSADALEMELREFVDCVRTRRLPAVTGAQGRNALAVALEVIQAVRKNNRRLAQTIREAGMPDCALLRQLMPAA